MRSSWEEDEGPEGWGRLTSAPSGMRIRDPASQLEEDLDRAGSGEVLCLCRQSLGQGQLSALAGKGSLGGPAPPLVLSRGCYVRGEGRGVGGGGAGALCNPKARPSAPHSHTGPATLHPSPQPAGLGLETLEPQGHCPSPHPKPAPGAVSNDSSHSEHDLFLTGSEKTVAWDLL